MAAASARRDNSIVKVDGSAHAARASQPEKLEPDATPAAAPSQQSKRQRSVPGS
jgi:hypothetical protein